MKLCKPLFEIWEQSAGLEGVYKMIEYAGRVCYKSEDKITEDSAKPFVDRMIKSGHGAMLEHGTVYLMVHTIDPKDWDTTIARHPRITIDDVRDYLRTNPTYDGKGEKNWWAKEAKHIAYEMAVKYADNPYSKVKIVSAKHKINTKGGVIVTPTGKMPIVTEASGEIISVFNTILIMTNLRVLVENNWLDDLKYICEPTEHHEKRITVKFITDQGILREFTRHRRFSFAVESTRYCNYSRSKFSNEVTFIQPNWISDEDIKNYHMDLDYFTDQDDNHITAINRFMSALKNAEYFYKELIKLGWKPQQARNVLPLATKCDMVMTGFVSDWKHFFELRDAASAHPQAQELAHSLHEIFIQRGYIKD